MSLSLLLQQYCKKIKSLPGKNFSENNDRILYSDTLYKETPRYACLSGVLTVEAALISVILLYFFLSILFFFRVMQTQLEIQSALDETARRASVVMALSGEESGQSSSTVVKALFLSESAECKIADKYITGGIAGVGLTESDLTGDDVDLLATYHIKLPFHFFGLGDFQMISHSNARKWTGWNASDRDDAKEEQWVYITENGSVYHIKEECTHLTLSISSVSREALSELRNENGRKYYACQLCEASDNRWDRVYITNQGLSYHNDLNCSGLKRTILKVHLSDVGERTLCMRCGAQ